MQKTAAQLVADAKHRIENLSPDQVVDELDRGGVLLVGPTRGRRANRQGRNFWCGPRPARDA
jgi:hypothetical protein